MSTSVKGKDETVVEMVENSLSNSDQMAKVAGYEFMDAEKQMTIWQAAKAHKRILFYSMTNLGQAFGSFAGGPLAHRFGRRYVIMGFAIVSIIGVALQFTATTRGVLLGGKIINGFAVGGLLAVGTTYASE
ncbi:hypothetical protein ACLOAV_007830 [Pseudogymnoascus australis]